MTKIDHKSSKCVFLEKNNKKEANVVDYMAHNVSKMSLASNS